MVEILSEGSFRDHGFQVSVAGCDPSDVDLDCFGPANSFEPLFLQDTESRLGKIDLAISDRDTKSLRREGHALKGSCLELGADRMARFCEALIIAAQGENFEQSAAATRRIKREFARLRPVYESAKDGAS